MSESNVTEKDVFDAADEMLAKGERISNRTVLHKLGRGSMATICPLLRRWRELRKIATKSSGEDPPVTESVMETAKEMITRLRQVLMVEAKQEIDAASAVNAGKLSSAEAERDSAIADAEAAEADLRVVVLERDTLQTESKMVAAKNAQLHGQIGEASARATAAEMREGELRKHVEDLKSELATSHRMHDEERERSNQLRSEVAQTRLDLDRNAMALASAIADATHARVLATEAKERTEKTEAAAAMRIEAMAAECEQARRDAKEKGELSVGLQRELVAVKQKSDDFYALIKNRKQRTGKSVGRGAKSNVN
jgi:hypothetical protein